MWCISSNRTTSWLLLHVWLSTDGNDDSTSYIKFSKSVFNCLVFSATHIDPKMVFLVIERLPLLDSLDADSSYLKTEHRWQKALVCVSRSGESWSSVLEIFATHEQSITWHFELKTSEVSQSKPLIEASRSGLKAGSILPWNAAIVSILDRPASSVSSNSLSDKALENFTGRYATTDFPLTLALVCAFSARLRIVACKG